MLACLACLACLAFAQQCYRNLHVCFLFVGPRSSGNGPIQGLIGQTAV
jgi:hypothetical protein